MRGNGYVHTQRVLKGGGVGSAKGGGGPEEAGKAKTDSLNFHRQKFVCPPGSNMTYQGRAKKVSDDEGKNTKYIPNPPPASDMGSGGSKPAKSGKGGKGGKSDANVSNASNANPAQVPTHARPHPAVVMNESFCCQEG